MFVFRLIREDCRKMFMDVSFVLSKTFMNFCDHNLIVKVTAKLKLPNCSRIEPFSHIPYEGERVDYYHFFH